MSALKLFQLPISPLSARIRIIAAEKHIELDLSGPKSGGPMSPGLASVHPLSHAPVLIDGTLALADTTAIAEYLDERYPFPAMMPKNAPDRARTRTLVRFHDATLAPVIADAYTHMVDGRVTASDADAVHAQLISLERRVTPSPWFFGDKFGIADATFCLSVWYAVQVTHAAGMPMDEARLPKLLAWFDAARQRPSVAIAVRDAQSALDPSLVSHLCDPIWFGASVEPTSADEPTWSSSAA